MERETYRVNVTLDGKHAAKLRRLSERTRVHEGTLARSLLAGALDDADPDARNVAELLDSTAHTSAPSSGSTRPAPARRSRSTSCSTWLGSS
jgi:hypothetical protein